MVNQQQDHLHRTISRVAIVIAAVVACCLPAGYFALSYQYQTGTMQSEAEFNATLTTQYIALNPEMWQFQVLRLKALIETDHTERLLPEKRRILSLNNQVIAETLVPLDKPIITARTPLFDAGKTVGYFEVSRSLRPLLLKTISVALLALGLAIAVFAVLKILPMLPPNGRAIG